MHKKYFFSLNHFRRLVNKKIKAISITDQSCGNERTICLKIIIHRFKFLPINLLTKNQPSEHTGDNFVGLNWSKPLEIYPNHFYNFMYIICVGVSSWGQAAIYQD
jgi:hypothetical protein